MVELLWSQAGLVPRGPGRRHTMPAAGRPFHGTAVLEPLSMFGLLTYDVPPPDHNPHVCGPPDPEPPVSPPDQTTHPRAARRTTKSPST
ncbi:hypothetical protein [Brachybacterium sacelli]|uniref:hypothetical protein n=1 Tax=Brachybacterium sacelli TaxID=173364 RepID=UPI0036156215